MNTGKAWTVLDRYDNEIYLTWERWEHIVEPDNHPEVGPYLITWPRRYNLGGVNRILTTQVAIGTVVHILTCLDTIHIWSSVSDFVGRQTRMALYMKKNL